MKRLFYFKKQWKLCTICLYLWSWWLCISGP